MGTYIPFTEQQREQARLTDLAAFLRQCGEEVKRSGSENMWLDHGQKVTIRGNLWFHQYEQVGGDAVDFVRRFYNLDYREAVLTLTSMGVGMIREPVEPFTQKPLQIPAKYENMRRVYGYLLQRRGIDKEVLDTFAYRGLVYECDRYHNAVFVGIDKEKEIRHIHKRSTAAPGWIQRQRTGQRTGVQLPLAWWRRRAVSLRSAHRYAVLYLHVQALLEKPELCGILRCFGQGSVADAEGWPPHQEGVHLLR